MLILLAFQMTRAGFKLKWLEPRVNLFKFTSFSPSSLLQKPTTDLLHISSFETLFNEVSACFPQVSWMWRCHVLWKSTPHLRSWSRSKPTWKKSSRTTQRTAPASHRLCPPPHCPPPQGLSPGPVTAARIPTVRPPPWINPAASEPCHWPSTGSHFRPHRLWWWWRQEPIRSGPAWPWLCPPCWQTWMWSRDSEQKVSERFLDSYCCYYAVLVLLD